MADQILDRFSIFGGALFATQFAPDGATNGYYQVMLVIAFVIASSIEGAWF